MIGPLLVSCAAPQSGQPLHVTNLYDLPRGGIYEAVAVGRDSVWVTDRNTETHRLCRVASDGRISNVQLPDATASLRIAVDSHGDVWITTTNVLTTVERVVRVDASKATHEYRLPGDGWLWGIAIGADGALWFAENTEDRIGRITADGDFAPFPLPARHSAPEEITAGHDGALWFTEQRANAIGRVTLDGKIKEFGLGRRSVGLQAISAGPDGAVWFVELETNSIGRVAPDGRMTHYRIPTAESGAFAIAAGPDGNLWFTESNAGKIGRITPSGRITEFLVPDGGRPRGIARAPDGGMWFVSEGRYDRFLRIVKAADHLVRFVVSKRPAA